MSIITILKEAYDKFISLDLHPLALVLHPKMYEKLLIECKWASSTLRAIETLFGLPVYIDISVKGFKFLILEWWYG